MKRESYSPFSAYTPAASTKPVVPFCTVTPLVRTSVGSRASAVDTRFCTSTAARSTSRVTSNTTLMLAAPLLVLDEVM